jgi:hypothetical protein
MLNDVLAYQLTHYLRWRQVMRGADFFEHSLFAWINQQGKPGGFVFHNIYQSSG